MGPFCVLTVCFCIPQLRRHLFSQCWCVDVVAGESAADCASSHHQISAHVSFQMGHPVSQFRSKILSRQTAPWLYIPQVQRGLSFVWGCSGRNESRMIKLEASASASAFAKTRFASLPLVLQPATITLFQNAHYGKNISVTFSMTLWKLAEC